MSGLFKKKESTYEKKKPESRKDVKKDMEKVSSYILNVEAYSESVEKWYFWILEQLKEWGYAVSKTEDDFFAGELSGLWGISAQRLSLQQDKAQQIMGAINSMVKQIFQIVRSIRLTKQRLDIYRKTIDKHENSADVALKGLFIDMVQGGGKNPASVYGMASQLGFTTLPDLFFNIHIWNKEDIESILEDNELSKTQNKSVLNALKRHLLSFLEWRDATFEELKTSERFYLAALRQQKDAITMYIEWAKPYLQVIHKLKKAQFSGSKENLRQEDVISAFDTSTSDLEILAVRRSDSDKKRLKEIEAIRKKDEKTAEKLLNYEIRPVIRVKMHFRSAPVLTTGREYQRVPTHIGRCEINFEAYVMSENEIDAYIEDKNNEAFEYLHSVNSSLDSLGKELTDYLEEAENLHKIETGEIKEPKKKEPIFNFTKEMKSLGEGFSEIFAPLLSPLKSSSGKSSIKISRKELARLESKKNLDTKKHEGYLKSNGGLFLLFKIFRKAHGMVTW